MVAPAVVSTGCVVNPSLLAAAADTVKLTPAPAVVLVDNVPSVAFRVTGPSALYAINEPPAELMPLAKVINSAVPRFTAELVLLVTVGTVPLGALPSPLNVRLLSPVKLVIVFWNLSTSLIVSASL